MLVRAESLPLSSQSASGLLGRVGPAGHSLGCCPRRRLTSQIETIAPPIGHCPSCALKHPFADI